MLFRQIKLILPQSSGTVSKKIIIVGPSYPFRGGIAANNERLAREFQNSGSEVIIFTFSLQYPSFLFPGKTQYSEAPEPEGLDIRAEVNSINPFSWIKTGNKIKKLKPDILLFRYWIPFMAPCFGTIARIVKKNRHTKVISILDNFVPHEKRFGDKMLSKFFIKPVDGYAVMSFSVKADIKKLVTNKPIEYCPHPLFDHYGELLPKNEARKQLGLDENSKWLLFFGLIRDYKGLDLLLKSLTELPAYLSDIKLIVAGEFYSNQTFYSNLITELNINSRVKIFPEFIPDNKVAVFFSAADVVVQPYKHATQSGITQIAYHFNKPMIVTRVGGLAEIVPNEKVGFVVSPQPTDLANAITRFYVENRELEFSQNAASEKEKYSWKRMADTVYMLHCKTTPDKDEYQI